MCKLAFYNCKNKPSLPCPVKPLDCTCCELGLPCFVFLPLSVGKLPCPPVRSFSPECQSVGVPRLITCKNPFLTFPGNSELLSFAISSTRMRALILNRIFLIMHLLMSSTRLQAHPYMNIVTRPDTL